MKAVRTIAPQFSGEKADFYTLGINDEQVLLQAAAELPIAGGRIHLSAGSFSFDSIANITNPNIVIDGEWYATQIAISANGGIKFTNPLNARLLNLGIDGSKINAARVGGGMAVDIINPIDMQIDGCWILNCNGNAVFVDVEDTNTWGKVRIFNNRLSGLGVADVIGGGPNTPTGVLSEVIIKNNFIYQDASQGIHYRVAIDLVAQNKFIIKDNITFGNIGSGSEKEPMFQVDISGNKVSPANGLSNAEIFIEASPINSQFAQSNYIKIFGNQINQGHIYIQGDLPNSELTTKVLIAYNECEVPQNGHGDVNQTYGVYADYLQNAEISHNIFHNAVRGISYSNCSNLRINNNSFEGCTTKVFDAGGNSNIRVKDNDGLNPIGLSAINVTGSPFTYTAGTSPETVYITGGTVSSITKGGITLFTATEKSINLEPNESIIVTYSVLPTMNKDIH